jgi:hypothetical protein
MLGHSNVFDYEETYGLQTIRDNIDLLTPKLLAAVNEVVVGEGHNIINIKKENLKTRCDSAVTKTDTHYPTDINLLWDAMRKSIVLIGNLSNELEFTTWRQAQSQLNKIHQLYYACSQKSCKAGKDGLFNPNTLNTYDEYLTKSEHLIEKINETLEDFKCINLSVMQHAKIHDIKTWTYDAEYQIGLIVRRIFGGEKIPHHDKIHSLFERHTEWISKGKSGVSQELGLRVAILEDQFGFILSHRIMQNETDEKVPVKIIKDALKQYPNIVSCSFDKGFWTKQNRIDLEEILDIVAMKKKGYSSKENYKYEHSTEFLKGKKGHSAVESAFSALQNHGLNKCCDKGIHRFQRHVGSCIVARNIQKLGRVLINRESEATIRSEKIKAGLAKKKSA